VAERVKKNPRPVPMKLQADRSQESGPCRDRLRHRSVRIIDIHHELQGRPAQRVRRDRAEVGILVVQHHHRFADLDLGMTKRSVRRVDQPVQNLGPKRLLIKGKRGLATLYGEMGLYGPGNHRESPLLLEYIYVTFRIEMSQPNPPRRGRPPSAEARDRILRAAHDLLMADGFARLTVDAVAARSGASKPTIYRHWANAQELAMAALIEAFPPAPDLAPDEALEQHLSRIIATFATTRGRQVALALAAADSESELARAFRTHVILNSRQAGRKILETGIRAGRIAPPPDMEALLDMIYGAVFFRLILRHQPLDPVLATELSALVRRACPPLPGA
jgi:AcrR family transcriptional regulator